MKQCAEKRGRIYRVYNWKVYVPNTYDFIFVDNLEDVHTQWKRLRKKYPNKVLRVHRFTVVDSVDNCIKRDMIEKLSIMLKQLSLQ